MNNIQNSKYIDIVNINVREVLYKEFKRHGHLLGRRVYHETQWNCIMGSVGFSVMGA